MQRNRQHYGGMLALFDYLTKGIDAGAAIMEQQLFRLECVLALGTAEHEETLTAYVKLLYRHTEAGRGYKPGQMRQVLEDAIAQFPSNSIFLSMYYFNECTSASVAPSLVDH